MIDNPKLTMQAERGPDAFAPSNRDNTPQPVPATAESHEEANMLWREGLPSDAMILVPSVAAAPMRQPANTWAMLVLAADVVADTDAERQREVALFAGWWLAEQSPATVCEGDLVLLLCEPDDLSPPRDQVNVEMLLAHRGRWLRVGRWERLDPRWPWTVAATAAAILELHVEATEAAQYPSGTKADRPLRGWRGTCGLADLLAAGLVRAGEEFIWHRPGHGSRHTARIHPDGALVLADGRTYVNPSGALTALGGKHQNGWKAWKRPSDGRALGDLRAELRTTKSA